MRELGLTESVALSPCIDHPPEQVESAVAYMRQQRQAGKKLGKGYLVAAIRGDYGAELRQPSAVADERAAATGAWIAERMRETEPQRAEFQALPEGERKRLLAVFHDSPPPGWGRNAQEDFRKNRRAGRYAADVFVRWYANGRA